MDRVFLDANVLFSASHRQDSGLLRLWQLDNVEYVTSPYAMNEAVRNVVSDAHLKRLNQLVVIAVMPAWVQTHLPKGVNINEKDLPILLDAINSLSTHLLTGDKRHFGPLYGRRVSGVLIQPPSEYLASRSTTTERD